MEQRRLEKQIEADRALLLAFSSLPEVLQKKKRQKLLLSLIYEDLERIAYALTHKQGWAEEAVSRAVMKVMEKIETGTLKANDERAMRSYVSQAVRLEALHISGYTKGNRRPEMIEDVARDANRDKLAVISSPDSRRNGVGFVDENADDLEDES